MDTPVDTIRAWAIGMFLCTIVAAVNILMGLRKSPVTITASVVQLVAYPYVCNSAQPAILRLCDAAD